MNASQGNKLSKSEKWSSILLLSTFAIVLLIFKLVLINKYANATPFWDQWDAEAAFLFLPWVEGTLKWSDLIAPHNEHRILLTRLLALGLLELNGRVWNPILEMRVNAALHVLSLTILLNFLSKTFNFKNKISLLIFTLVIFLIPFGWENTLAGFQSAFYFLLLFSFIFLYTISTCQIFTRSWWLGVLAGVLSVFSIASGAVTLLAGVVILIIRYYIEKKDLLHTTKAIVILSSFGIFAIYSTLHIKLADTLKADTVNAFLQALATALSWPTMNSSFGWLIIYAPAIYICIKLIRSEHYRRPLHVYIFTLFVWVLAQSVILAYGRVTTPTSSRYLDLLLIGLIVNFAGILVVFQTSEISIKMKYFFSILLISWIAIVMQGLYERIEDVKQALVRKQLVGLDQERNVRAYLCDQKVEHLNNKLFLEIPYPDPERLKNLIDNKAIRALLPGNIYEPNISKYIKSNAKWHCV